MPKRIGYQKPRARRRTYIKEWREYRQLSQEALGERLDTSGSMISRIENNETPYTQDTLEAIAEALMTDPASLLMRLPPKDGEETIWSIWDQAKPGQRRIIMDVAKSVTKTGTE